MGARGPARKPKLQVVREGNPGKRSRPDPILLPPGAPPEPKWLELELNGPGTAGRARSARIRRTAQALWRHWVSVLDPQGVLATVDAVVLQDAALCAARLQETERQISSEAWIQIGQKGDVANRLFTRADRLRLAFFKYIPQLGLSPASRLEAREGGRPDADFDDI